jgi:transcriptional regulator with XRE-family HTH domain
MKYGEKVRYVRKKKGKTATELAKYLEVTSAMVSNVERGISQFSDDNTLKMAKYFEIPVDFFLNENYISLEDFEMNDKTKNILADSDLINYIVLADKAKKADITPAELDDAINFIIQIKKARKAD